MDQIFPIQRLEVIGFKEIPAREPFMPRLLSPIFGVHGSDLVLFPPYTQGEEEVIRPKISARSEFDDLVACSEISSFEGFSSVDAIQALPDHELWIDDLGNIHYESSYFSKESLNLIFSKRLVSAKQALGCYSLLDARTHAMIAYSANPSSIEPLLYRAASEYCMLLDAYSEKIEAELFMTEVMAKSHMDVDLFKKSYKDIIHRGSNFNSVIKVNEALRNVSSKYKNIAIVKPSEKFDDLLEHAIIK